MPIDFSNVPAYVQQLRQDEERRLPVHRYAPEQPLQVRALDPRMAGIVGSLADVASTYAFLKRGTGIEANPLAGPLNNHPEGVTLASLVGAFLTSKGIGWLKKSHPQLAEVLAANQGALQMQLAHENLNLKDGDSFSEVRDNVFRFLNRERSQ